MPQGRDKEELHRKYRPDELLMVKSVTKRLDSSVQDQEAKNHKKARKLSKELSISYDKALEKIRRKKKPKKAKVSNEVNTKADLFEY